jgi:RNA polymerase sigma factor (sigma-70 family)
MSFERELVVRAQAGDQAAQEELVRQFSPMVFRLVSRFFRRREDVEDLAQDVFFKVFTRIDQVRPSENFPGWLRQVAIHTCYDELRKTRRRNAAFEIYGPLQENEPLAPAEAPPEPGDFGIARAALDALDAKLKIPLILKEVEELSVAEIAQTMGITQTNVKVRLFRARRKLAESLAKVIETGPNRTKKDEEGRRRTKKDEEGP